MLKFNHKFKNNERNLALELCQKILPNTSTPIFLCVGDSKIVSDCLGPTVGELLKTKHNINGFVYGDLRNNVNKENLPFYLNFIKENHLQNPVIVIDAGLNTLENVGLVKITTNNVLLGSYKNNEPIKTQNSINIIGYINTTGINSLLFLKSVQLKTVLEMSNFIANSIDLSLKFITQLQQNNAVENF